MFTRKEKILKKTGPNGIGRYQYLKLLTQEFKLTKSLECKQQILANLANFSYDPINYDFIRNLSIIDLFISQLTLHEHESIIHLAVAGLCNLSADNGNQEIIIQRNGISLVGQYLLHNNKDIALNALTALLYLITPENKHYLTTKIIHDVLKLNVCSDKRFKNLTAIFLEDLCSEEEIQSAKLWEPNSVHNIPLPSDKISNISPNENPTT